MQIYWKFYMSNVEQKQHIKDEWNYILMDSKTSRSCCILQKILLHVFYLFRSHAHISFYSWKFMKILHLSILYVTYILFHHVIAWDYFYNSVSLQQMRIWNYLDCRIWGFKNIILEVDAKLIIEIAFNDISFSSKMMEH